MASSVLITSLLLSVVVLGHARTVEVRSPLPSHLAVHLVPPQSVMDLLNPVVSIDSVSEPASPTVETKEPAIEDPIRPKLATDTNSQLDQRTFQNINPLNFLNSDLFLSNGLALANLLFQRPDGSENGNANGNGFGAGFNSQFGSGGANGNTQQQG